MKEKVLNSEDRIKEAARKIFRQKGYKGATSRDIAKEAGLNVSLTNYYFRKKEKLFQIIFMESIHEFLDDILGILNKPLDLSQKMRLIMDKEIELQSNDPDLFVFVYSEIRSNAENFIKEIGIMKDRLLKKWSEQIKENIKKKIIRNIDPISALSIILGHMYFPIIASTLLKEIGEFTDETYKEFLEKQKDYAIEMITDFLFLEKQ